MASNTGIDWAAWADWADYGTPIALTVAGTITDLSPEIDCDGKSDIMISIDTTFSDHARLTGGLVISILRDVNSTEFETADVASVHFELKYNQNGDQRKAFPLDVSQFSKIKIQQDWENTTASAVATTKTNYKFGDVPAAVA